MKVRPRFSVRTLAIVVTLVCAYFAAWGPTKKYGVPRIQARGLGQTSVPVASPAPFVLKSVEYDRDSDYPYLIRYHLWFFGPVITLPFNGVWTEPMTFKGPYSPLELQEKQRATGGRVKFEQ